MIRRRGAKAAEARQGEAGRREQILGAATELFRRYGYRRTSMELLAAEAGVAKPTLYAYFEAKEALFRAVCEHTMSKILDDAQAAVAAEGPLAARLTGLLAAKFSYLFDLVHRSPHGAELLASQEQLGADVVDRADRAYLKLLTTTLEEAEERGEIAPARAGLTRAALASVLLRCGHGAGYGATSAAQHRKHLGELLQAVLAGVR